MIYIQKRDLEAWKPVKGHEDFYEVSSMGRVRNITTDKFIVGDINSSGYYRVTLYQPFKKRYFRHRLVATMFIENHDESKIYVNHIDGSKENNSVGNLEWVSQSENELHAHRTGLKTASGAKMVKVTYPEGKVVFFKSNTDACIFFGYKDVANITYAIQRGGWKRGENAGIKIENV